MSQLFNPLDKFSSYSTHYIMVACRTTERAREFASERNSKLALSAIERVTALGDEIPFASPSDAFLVMDTRRFSQFSIENLKYEVLINGLVAGNSHANFYNAVDMTILDSVGVSFINFMQWLMDEKMKCNFDGIIFMLKVLFVGHSDDGSTETVDTVTIPMFLNKMELALTDVKGVYTCSFFPTSNFDVNHNKKWLNIGTATSYFTGRGNNTLGAMVKSFERELNRKSSEYYEKVSAVVTKYRQPRPGTTKYGRKVVYQITLPSSWETFQYNGASTGGATETDFAKLVKATEAERQKATEEKAPTTDSHLSVSAGLSITDVLDLMFKQCLQTQQLGIATTESTTFYKHLVNITSDDDTFTVHVDVVEFVVPNTKNTQQSTVSEQEAAYFYVNNGKRIPKNSFELNYMFTGLNKDVLSFDVKMQDVAILLASNIKVGEGELFATATEGQYDRKDVTKDSNDLITSRAFDPILLPTNSESELKNFEQYAARQGTKEQKALIADTQRYMRNLSAYYANSTFTAAAVIKGNPSIMQKFNISEIPQHTNSSSPSSTYRKDLEKRILANNREFYQNNSGAFVLLDGPSYVTSPVFVKMNVKGPNVDFRTNDLLEGEDFASEIFFDQYFTVQKVTNTIEAGVFTQELLLYTHNLYAGTPVEKGTTKV
jgi:hypothetical protein